MGFRRANSIVVEVVNYERVSVRGKMDIEFEE
jgi:hypothetical protein